MARKRSYNELTRLLTNLGSRLGNLGVQGKRTNLTRRAMEQASKYRENVKNSKSLQNADKRYRDAFQRGDNDAMRKIARTSLNRKYSANTYKGINAG